MSFLPLPDPLKSLTPYFQQAEQFDSRDPITSYYCRIYSIQEALKEHGSSTDEEVRGFLVKVLDYLEDVKAKSQGDVAQALANEMIGQAHVEACSLRLFSYADQEDQAGRSNKSIALTFRAAMICFEVLKYFGPLDSELEEKLKYSKYKAAYIAKCIREGIPPSSSHPPSEEAPSGPPPYSHLSGLPSVPNPAPSPPTTTFHSAPSPSNLNVQNQGSDGPTLTNTSTSTKPPTSSLSSAPPPPKPPSKSPSQFHPHPSAPPVSEPNQWRPEASTLNYQEIDEAQKLCRFAISALNYDDVETATNHLRSALTLLTRDKPFQPPA